MLAFDEIQDQLKTLLDANAFFSDWSVIVRDGFNDDTIETALDTNGAAAVIGLPYDSTTETRAPGVNLTSVMVPVVFRVKPVRDPATGAMATATKSKLTEALTVGVAAILAYNPSDEADRFQMQERPVILETDDTGLLCYVALFECLTTFDYESNVLQGD